MASNTLHVLKLIELLAEDRNQTLDYAGFGAMSNVLDEPVSQRYLDDLYRDTKQKISKEIFTTRKSKLFLDKIAQYLGFKNFDEFSATCNKEFSEIIKACIGYWWSYVRANSGNYILKAPVRIFLDDNKQKIMMELRGAERTFIGEIVEKEGCMTGFLNSGTAKRLGVCFKLGLSKQIQVTQGVFCGISSTGNPIAGKEILVREERIPFENMRWEKFPITDDRIDENIRNYFTEYNKTCIQVKDVSGFDLESLNSI